MPKQAKKATKKTLQDKMKRLIGSPATESFLASFLAILSGLMLGFIIMLIVRPEMALGGFFTILTAGFQRGLLSTGNVLLRSIPLILAGLSVGFAFRAGLFNIGATGQLTMGGFAAIYVGVNWTWLPGATHWIVAIIAAMLVGAIWASIPGILKAYRNVHEVVSTIMMNYIAMFLVQILVVQTVYNSTHEQSRSVPVSARLPNLGLDTLFQGSRVHIGIFIAIAMCIIIYIILFKTTLGYQLRMVGYNRDAAKYAGVNEKRNIVYSMLIAGALAGLAGAMIYLRAGARHIEIVSMLVPEGFEGIAVALLGLSHPMGILFAGIFFGYLKVGALYMQGWDFEPEIIDIIIASIIYFSALSMVFRKSAIRMIKKVLGKKRGVKDETIID